MPLAEVVRSPFTESQEARVMLTEGGFSALVRGDRSKFWAEEFFFNAQKSFSKVASFGSGQNTQTGQSGCDALQGRARVPSFTHELRCVDVKLGTSTAQDSDRERA